MGLVGQLTIEYLQMQDLVLYHYLEMRLASSKEANINSIAVILKNFAQKKYKVDDVSNLSMEQWKYVVGRYNARDDNPTDQNKYSSYVFEYLEPLKTLMK